MLYSRRKSQASKLAAKIHLIYGHMWWTMPDLDNARGGLLGEASAERGTLNGRAPYQRSLAYSATRRAIVLAAHVCPGIVWLD
jgi:hypothetical protein